MLIILRNLTQKVSSSYIKSLYRKYTTEPVFSKTAVKLLKKRTTCKHETIALTFTKGGKSGQRLFT